VEVLRCEALARDGTVLVGGADRPDGNARFLVRSIVEASAIGSDRVSLYLAIPRANGVEKDPGAEPMAFSGSGALPPRFWLQHQELADLYDSQMPPADVVGVQVVVSIVADCDDAFAVIKQGAELIKFCELTSPRPKTFAPVRDYVPPALCLGAASSLVELTARVHDHLNSKLGQLAGARKQVQPAGGAVTVADLARIALLQTLGRSLPWFEHALHLRTAHPEALYLRLRELVADLAALSEGFDAIGDDEGGCRPFPAFDQDDLRGCLRPLVDVVDRALESLAAGPVAGYRFVHDGMHFVTQVPAEVLAAPGTRYFLLVSGQISRQELLDKLQNLGKIGAKDIMRVLVASKTPGLALRTPAEVPQELPRPSSTLNVFEIATEGPVWVKVAQTCNVAIDTPLAPGEVSMTLYPVGGGRP
jgi:type VI secretion system ImpJ/VasE family protein